MKQIVFFVFFILLSACSINRPPTPEEKITAALEAGNYTCTAKSIDSLIWFGTLSKEKKVALRYSLDSIRRVELDFNRSREEVIGWIKEHHRFTPTDDQLKAWETSGVLEYRIIDGDKRYFRNAAANLFRVDSQARSLSQALPDTVADGTKKILDSHLTQLIPTEIKGKYLLPKVAMQVKYTLTVEPGVSEEGETIRTWLPYPRQDIRRQGDVQFIGASQEEYTFSADKTGHTSIYMEKPSRIGKAAVFSVENLRAIYRYITANYPWASALEYSTIPDIPAYVLENGRGDCGQVTLLLITMLRYKGIPARWQSGWMTHGIIRWK